MAINFIIKRLHKKICFRVYLFFYLCRVVDEPLSGWLIKYILWIKHSKGIMGFIGEV